MGAGPRRSTERRNAIGAAAYEVVPEEPLALTSWEPTVMPTGDLGQPLTIFVDPQGNQLLVRHLEPSGFLGDTWGTFNVGAADGVFAGQTSLTEYSWKPDFISSQPTASRPVEPQATVRVLTLKSSGHESMNPIAAHLAELTRSYALADSYDWLKLQKTLGPVRIFAIESAPVTFDVDQSTEEFTGRARVLADVLDPADEDTFLESRVLDARVYGRFEDGVPSIRAFEFQSAT